jgi:sugar fermentation stimulation protein A
MRGTYCLVSRLESDEKIAIGRKEHGFSRGYYVYVGSAMNNLEKRIERHRSGRKKLRWHIDYFLQRAKITGVETIISDRRLECELSRAVKRLADGEPMKGFGSSDCRSGCATHLYYFRKDPLADERFMNLFVKDGMIA